MAILQVEDLRVIYFHHGRAVEALGGATFDLQRGELLGIAGESGSGKTSLGLAIMGLIPPPGKIKGGSIRYRGRDLLKLSPRELQKVRGKEIFMIFQSPSACLNPARKVGAQIAEVWLRDPHLGRMAKRRRVEELLEQVGLSREKAEAYPFQLSGGMRQRLLIAMALALQPRILVADEPTTGLDPLQEKEILTLLDRMRTKNGTSILLITHDLRVLARVADRILVMHQGAVVEHGELPAFIRQATEPHSHRLIHSTQILTSGSSGLLFNCHNYRHTLSSPS